MTRIATLLLAVLLAPALVSADDRSWDLAGNLEIESRLFANDASWPGQSSPTAALALAGTLEFRWRNDDGRQRVSVIPYARWDAQDSERSLFDLREAYWAYSGDNFEILVGANTVFWGVTESVHLVDIINQTDLAADIDGEQKLGQPMINLALQRDWGAIDVYVMPMFRERTHVGAAGRLRPPLPIDSGEARYTSPEGDDHIDVAARYSHYFGDIDVGLSVFHGTSREARWSPSEDGRRLLPIYDVIDQLGVDLQYTHDAWLWKLEAILRDGYSHTFAAATGGVEYTLFQVAESDADLGLLLEYQYDDRNALEPPTVNDNDVFVGTRVALNDVQDTSVLAGLSVDVDTGEVLVNIEAERRFGDAWVAEARARVFSGARQGDPTWALAEDDYVELRVARYF